MPHIELRVQAQTRSADDITLTVQDKTFDYLMHFNAPEVRVSAYFDRDWNCVQDSYAEIFIHEDCAAKYEIVQLKPGSKIRKKLTLPCAMKTGEQLVIVLKRLSVNTEDQVEPPSTP